MQPEDVKSAIHKWMQTEGLNSTMAAAKLDIHISFWPSLEDKGQLFLLNLDQRKKVYKIVKQYGQ